MNKKQLSYQVFRPIIHNADVIFLPLTVGSGYASVNSFLNSQEFSDIGTVAVGTGIGLLAIYSALQTIITGVTRLSLHQSLNNVKKIWDSYPHEFPLEQADRIIIDDAEGLDTLLAKTHEGARSEWGTLLKAHSDKQRAVIYDVLDSKIAKEKGLVGEGKKAALFIEDEKACEEGYAGFHHYHPNLGPKWLGAMNFTVGMLDRYRPINWMNLLTFNLPEGPEIIGFNRQYTYIPVDKAKRELVMATPKQIMTYLST